ncbi:MAG: LD-carboxypeptidase [Deltaproteobacteria bacterium]|nr:LD-carboxypeptidase [Deltaproteobacteria bacterium]
MLTSMALIPQALHSLDYLGIFAPASPVRLEYVRKGQEFILRSGYRCREGNSLLNRAYHVAGDVASRLTDFENLLLDPEIKALVAARGGYGSMTLLPRLNYNLIAENPKIILGFSDITALQLALWHKIGLITFSGPMLAVEMARPGTVNSDLLWALLTGVDAAILNSLLSASLALDEIEFIRSKDFSGRSLGGTLTILAALAGTSYMPDFTGKIIFLEDRGEPLYRIDRALTQLRLSGVFNNPAAVVCGDFALPNSSEVSLLPGFLREFFADDDFPVLINFPYGHCSQSFIFPQGGKLQFECRERKISILESPVSR